MKKLSVSLDQIGLLRESRRLRTPDPVAAAAVAELAGADSICVHLRLDRRSIRERDLFILRETIKTRLNLQVAPKSEMLNLISEIKPQEVTLVPERTGELYTERGLMADDPEEFDRELMAQIQATGARLFLLVEPENDDIKSAAKASCDGVQLYTNNFVTAKSDHDYQLELSKVEKSAELAVKHNLEVRAGGGLNYRNIFPLVKNQHISEFVVGHAVVAQALMVGLQKALEDMVTIVKWS